MNSKDYNLSGDPVLEEMNKLQKESLYNDQYLNEDCYLRLNKKINDLEQYIEANRAKVDNYDKLLIENLELKEKNHKLEDEITNKKSIINSSSPPFV